MAGLDETYRDIKSMKIRGALDIALAAVGAMGSVAKEDAKDTADMIKKLDSAGELLKSARPTAVSLPNSLNYISYLAKKKAGTPLPEFRKELLSDIERFVEDQEKALERIGEIGANLIEKGDTILTHCNSDTVMTILKKAWDDGKDIKVVCTESRPRFQGHLSAAELSSHGIPTTLIIDSAVHLMLRELKVDKVLVGADTICANGDLINKIGTSQVALCAKELGIDFIVATECLKFSAESVMGSVIKIEERDASEVLEPGKIKGVNVMNPAFDVTDTSYISMIVTEYGVMPPQAAYHLLKEKFGWELNL